MAKFRITDQWNLGFLPVTFVLNAGVNTMCKGDELEKTELVELPPVPHASDWGDVQWAAAPSPDKYALTHSRMTKEDLFIHLEALFRFKAGTALTIMLTMGSQEQLNAFKR
jgi:hypothetical protein